jgi:uncharacterized protein YacL (UPF0231 family)
MDYEFRRVITGMIADDQNMTTVAFFKVWPAEIRQMVRRLGKVSHALN